MHQGTHKPQGPAGPSTSSSGREGDLGQVPDIWPAWTEHLRAAPGTTDLLCVLCSTSEPEEEQVELFTVCESCVCLWGGGKGSALTVWVHVPAGIRG